MQNLNDNGHAYRQLNIRHFEYETAPDFTMPDDLPAGPPVVWVDERTTFQTEAQLPPTDRHPTRVVASVEMRRGLLLYFYDGDELLWKWHVDGDVKSQVLTEFLLIAMVGNNAAQHMIQEMHGFDGQRLTP